MMRTLLYILALLLATIHSYGQRYRLVADSTFKYDRMGKQNPSAYKVAYYGYKKKSNNNRTYDNPIGDCDTMIVYISEGNYVNQPGYALKPLMKDVHSFNERGFKDTVWSYGFDEHVERMFSKTVNVYKNDTSLLATYSYKIKNIPNASSDILLHSKDTFVYNNKGVLTKKVSYELLSNIVTAVNRYKTRQKGEGLLRMEETHFINNNPAVTEYYFAENCPEFIGDRQGVLKRKRYVYDDKNNELSFNSYIVSDDNTEKLWDSTSNVYNKAGNIVEVYYTTHYSDCATTVWNNKYTYDKNGKLQSVERLKEILQEGKYKKIDLYEYTYDDSGRVLTKTTSSPSETDYDEVQYKSVEEFFYTSFGRKKAILQYSSITENGTTKKRPKSKTTYTYEAY